MSVGTCSIQTGIFSDFMAIYFVVVVVSRDWLHGVVAKSWALGSGPHSVFCWWTSCVQPSHIYLLCGFYRLSQTWPPPATASLACVQALVIFGDGTSHLASCPRLPETSCLVFSQAHLREQERLHLQGDPSQVGERHWWRNVPSFVPQRLAPRHFSSGTYKTLATSSSATKRLPTPFCISAVRSLYTCLAFPDLPPLPDPFPDTPPRRRHLPMKVRTFPGQFLLAPLKLRSHK